MATTMSTAKTVVQPVESSAVLYCLYWTLWDELQVLMWLPLVEAKRSVHGFCLIGDS